MATVETHGEYNFDEYNAPYVEYNNATIYASMDAETLAPSDVRTFLDSILKLETFTVTDAIFNVFTVFRSFVEFVLLVDTLTKSITDKRLSDSIRLQDWISLRKSPAANIWSD